MDIVELDKVLAKYYEEFSAVCNAMDYDEGSYLKGCIDTLEWILEDIKKA